MTASVSLFMASKYLEVEAMVLGDCSEVLLRSKYSSHELLDREQEIYFELGCELDAPTCLDFMMFYCRMIKFEIASLENHCVAKYSDSVSKMFLEVETLTYDLCRVHLLDS
jgi:hypothetical protein